MAESLPPGTLAYRWAAVAERFRLPPTAVALLTDAQIDEVLFHPRDAEGVLSPPPDPRPKAPPTKESRLAGIAQLRALGVITDERAAELTAEVESLYG